MRFIAVDFLEAKVQTRYFGCEKCIKIRTASFINRMYSAKVKKMVLEKCLVKMLTSFSAHRSLSPIYPFIGSYFRVHISFGRGSVSRHQLPSQLYTVPPPRSSPHKTSYTPEVMSALRNSYRRVL
jgi:hypothetical protein